jgi:hypothetical protein
MKNNCVVTAHLWFITAQARTKASEQLGQVPVLRLSFAQFLSSIKGHPKNKSTSNQSPAPSQKQPDFLYELWFAQVPRLIQLLLCSGGRLLHPWDKAVPPSLLHSLLGAPPCRMESTCSALTGCSSYFPLFLLKPDHWIFSSTFLPSCKRIWVPQLPNA